MFDHIGLRTAEFDRLKLFYEAALQPLALAVLAEYPAAPASVATGKLHSGLAGIGACALERPHRIPGAISS
jgi:hypothetical protein